jgi:adenine-specific DNA methylase
VTVTGERRADGAASLNNGSGDVRSRMIDRWFPCSIVDSAVGSPSGSGRNEKAIFPWFASRPIAQARAAVLTTLLPDETALRPLVERAVQKGDVDALRRLGQVVGEGYAGRRPVVLDVFSGRAILPLEAARLGVTAVGTDLSPVATLAGRLLADWPLRDWSNEQELPHQIAEGDWQLDMIDRPRLVRDARALHSAIGERLRAKLAGCYPANPDGRRPWGYLWTVTMPCDQCHRRFPLLGSLVLRHPYKRTGDAGQSMRLTLAGDTWHVEVIDGSPQGEPTYSSAGRKNKSARCPFRDCHHVHPLETVKEKGKANQYEDAPLLAADFASGALETKKVFRVLRQSELKAIQAADPKRLPSLDGLSGIPDELIPPANGHTVMASGWMRESPPTTQQP